MQRIIEIAEKAEIPKRVTPHSFRHSWALRAYKAHTKSGERIPINKISEYLGHADPAITLRLYGKEMLSDEELDSINERL